MSKKHALPPPHAPATRHLRTLATLAVLHTALPCAHAQPEGPPPLVSSTFVQAGFAKDARAYVVGASWDWGWKRAWGRGQGAGYWESSIGQWRTRNAPEGDHGELVTQVGITPVLRWRPDGPGAGLFVELGVGANVLFPIYRTESKRFSTSFNFGDHLAVGRAWGRNEISLRLQHFSNAGIKHPNPGENFTQLRYAIRY